MGRQHQVWRADARKRSAAGQQATNRRLSDDRHVFTAAAERRRSAPARRAAIRDRMRRRLLLPAEPFGTALSGKPGRVTLGRPENLTMAEALSAPRREG